MSLYNLGFNPNIEDYYKADRKMRNPKNPNDRFIILVIVMAIITMFYLFVL